MTGTSGGSELPLTMTDSMDLVRYAVSLEAAAARDGTQAASQDHTAQVRNLARRIQNEATSGIVGKYTVADIALVRELVAKAGPGGSASRIAAAVEARVPPAG
jgi:DNA-binding GntR family transcriptional regulator